jgi:hypothetical protein
MVLTLGADDPPRRIVADAAGRIALVVRSGGLRVGEGADAFTIYEEGELECCGTAELRLASPGCTTVAEVLCGSVS